MKDKDLFSDICLQWCLLQNKKGMNIEGNN